MLPHALLKALGEIVDLFVGEMTYVTDAECCFLDLSLSFPDLNAELCVEPTNQSFDIEPGRRNNAGNSVTRSLGVDFHVQLMNQRPNPLCHCGTSGKNFLLALGVNKIQRCFQLEQQGKRRGKGNRSLVLRQDELARRPGVTSDLM